MDLDLNPKLTNLCNEKTVQEDSRGFFNSLIEEIVSSSRMREWMRDLWENPLFGEDFILTLIRQNDIFQKITETFTVKEVYRKKCNKTAMAMLSEAEDFWVKENWTKCREHCSQAILRATDIKLGDNQQTNSQIINGSSILQQAFLLRAQCLLRENKIDFAKKDVNRSLQFGPLKDKLKKDLQLILKTLKNSSAENKHGTTEHKKDVIIAGGEHQTLPNASKLVQVSKSDREGRFITSSENVKIGDNLVIEQPYVACLKPQYFGSFCHNCFARLEAPIGCLECAAVAFCGENCYNEANNTYHKYECKFMDLFIGSGMSILSHISLRMVTQIGLSNSLEIYEKYGKNSNNFTNSNNQIKNEKSEINHASVYQLCTHEKYRNQDDYMRRTMMAFFLMKCLQKTTFFNTSLEFAEKEEKTFETLNNDEIAIWCILLFNLQVLQFNAHQVMAPGKIELACALYPTAALFNHDCSPSVTRYFQGKQIIIQALRPIQPGELVGDNYGPQWGRGEKKTVGQSREERQCMLRSRYWFFCRCVACLQNWPTSPPQISNIRCPNDQCNGSIENLQKKCNVCTTSANPEYVNQKTIILKKCLENFELGHKIEDTEEKLKVLTAILCEYWSFARQPCLAALRAEDSLRSCYGTLLSKK